MDVRRTADLSPEEKRRFVAELLRRKREQARTFPLSFGQQRLWFLDQLAPGHPFYTIAGALRLPHRGLDAACLERALSRDRAPP